MKISGIKKTTMFLAVLMLGCAGVYAQSPQPTDSNSSGFKSHKHHQMGGGISMLSEKLGLTAEQQASIKTIFATDANQIRAIRQKGVQEVNSILTPEQQQKFAQLKKHALHQWHRRQWNRLAMLSKKLGLTDEQKTSIKAVFATDANEIKAIRQNSSLSQEQKQTEIKTIWQKGKAQVNALLTPDQQAKLAELKKQGMFMGHRRMHSGHKWQHGQTPSDSNS